MFFHFQFDFVEGSVRWAVFGGFAAKCLPASYDGVDIARLELQAVTASANTLGGNHGGTTTEKGVQHDVAAFGAIQQSIGDKCYRLHSWMECQEMALVRRLH